MQGCGHRLWLTEEAIGKSILVSTFSARRFNSII